MTEPPAGSSPATGARNGCGHIFRLSQTTATLSVSKGEQDHATTRLVCCAAVCVRKPGFGVGSGRTFDRRRDCSAASERTGGKDGSPTAERTLARVGGELGRR